jgi:hypothetical protein
MSPSHTASEPRVYFLVTVDGDLRIGAHEQQEASVRAMRGIHASLGLMGRTSWMINEIDFRWTDEHARLLWDLADTGEAIGVHDHLDTHFAATYDQALDLMGRSRRQLEEFFRRMGRGVALPAHRNGCSIQSEASYRALRALGYSVLSDVRPGVIWHARMVCDRPAPNPWRCLGAEDDGAIRSDNSAVPLAARPWHHDAHNWLDFTSRQGPFLQVPVTCAPFIERPRFEAVVQGSERCAFLVLDTHPYDLQDPATGAISAERVIEYRQAIEWIRNFWQVLFIRIDQVESVLDSGSEADAGEEGKSNARGNWG